MTKDSGRSSTYKIYVGNLSPTTTNHDLVRVFSSYGSVIEAVALANKGFGFVHMASEEDGVRAMKSLYKYILNGKEMVVQPAINPKKASVTPYNSFKRATIGGRGVTNLDDFEDYCADSYLDQEIANCIQADSSPTSDQSSLGAANFYNYCSTASSPSSNAAIPKLSSINTSTVDNNRNRELVVVSANSQGSSSSVRSNGELNTDQQQLQQQQHQQCGNGLSSLLSISKGGHNNSGLPSIWDGCASSNSAAGSESSVLNINSILHSTGAQSYNNPHSNLGSSLNGVNPSLVDQLLSNNSNKLIPVSKQLSTTAIGTGECNSQISSILANYSHQIHQLRVALSQNPNNPQIIAALTKLHQQERALSQSSLQSDQINSDQHIQNSILKLKQEQLQEQELQRLLMQQQLQKQRQEQQQHLLLMNNSGLNGNNCIGSQSLDRSLNSTPLLSTVTNGLPSSISSSLPLSCGSSSFSMNTATNTNAPTKANFINGNNGHSNGFSNNNNHHFMNPPPTTNASGLGNSGGMAGPPLCGLCNEGYDSGSRVPKILGCTHTFCLRCLFNATSASSSEVRCLGGCGLATHLSEAGVAGLTTNQAALSATLQYNARCNRAMEPALNNTQLQPQQPLEVCAACTGTRQDQPLDKCREEGHTLVLATDAVRVIRMQLKPLVENTLSTLREAMKLRAGIKERVESTLQSLAKFIDELQAKLDRDNIEEELLISTLNDLNCVHQQMGTHTYSDLVRTYHMVEKCSKDINLQYNQCLTATCINNAVRAMILKIHPESLPAINKLGVNQDEVFVMEQSLQEHALSGNYANVLLQYMVADLLASRLSHNALLSKDSLGLVDCHTVNYLDNGDNLSNHPDSRSVCSASPGMGGGGSDATACVLGGDGAYASLTVSSAATPDMTAMNGGGHGNLDSLSGHLDHMDINCVIQTTEAIEAENGARSKSEMNHFSDSTSLGLSNICHMVTDEETLETIDLEKSLLEGSACIEPETTAVQSSAPSPSSSNSITPPIVSSANRSSVDSSAASSDSGISSCKPFSYLDAAKKPAKPQPEAQPKTEVVKMPPQLKQIKTPHCWMKVAVDGKSIGRIVFQLRPDKAPKMCENFLGLCTGKPGYGYQGTHFFKNGDGFLAGGDVEFDDGSGGYSIFGQKKFEADLCPLKDEVGMIRFKGNGTSDSGRGMVGSQFMVWYAEREFKKFSYSLVFGRVVDGLDVVKKAANVNLGKHDVMIEECGGIM